MTTSPNLAIEHILNAEQDKETTFNEGIDNIDRALAQYLAYTVSVNATLTAAEALYMFIEFVGAPGAARTIKLPTNKLYIFKNSVAGGFSVNVCGTTGGFAPTLEIPNGETVIVYNEDDNEIHFVSRGADISAAYLLNGSIPTGMGGAVNINSIAASLKFTPSGAGVVPLVAKGFSGQTANLFEAQNNSNTTLLAIDASGDINFQNAQKGLNAPFASGSGEYIPKDQADALYAPIGAAYLTNGANGTLTNEVNVQSIGTTLVFTASSGAVTPFALKGGSSPSVNLFEARDNSNTVQFAIDSSYQLDCKSNFIVNVKDPTSAQHAATRNYVDTNTSSHVFMFGNTLGGSDTTTRFLDPGFVNRTEPATEAKLRATFAGKASQLHVRARTGPVTQGYTITVRKNGVNQALTCTLAAGATTASDTSNSFTFAKGDDLSVQCTGVSGITVGATDLIVTFSGTLT